MLECGGDSPGDDQLVESFKYIADGILVSLVGTIGVLGNISSLLVLSRPRLRDCFHNLLFALACFDTLYIVFGGINYTMKAFELANTRIYTLTFPYIIYPFTSIGLSGTIFMTVAISIERFLGVCYPLHLPPHTRKSWFYILPVIFLSICINIPKFLEARVTWHNEEPHIQVLLEEMEEHPYNHTLNSIINTVNYLPASYTPSIRPTALRQNTLYIKYYIVYFRLVFMHVLPLLIMIFLNVRIALDIRSAKVQRFGSARKMKKEFNFCLVLLCIVITFMCCHSPRTFVDIWEFSHTETIVACIEQGREYIPKRWVVCLYHVSHLCGVLNSSINFLIYCFVGRNFRQEFFKLVRPRYDGMMTTTTNTSLIERNQTSLKERTQSSLNHGNQAALIDRTQTLLDKETKAQQSKDEEDAASRQVL